MSISEPCQMLKLIEPHREKTMWILTKSDANQAAQPLEMAKGLKFWIKKIEGLYYPSSENKGADQLRGHREDQLRGDHEADLRYFFSIWKTLVFSRHGSIVNW